MRLSFQHPRLGKPHLAMVRGGWIVVIDSACVRLDSDLARAWALGRNLGA
ncbi:hypothetical protein [Burkholderia aenigmatica]|nr:hypothetical protein [Burkholderia aenigmatica]MDN7881262.1 hypothetical protein [Burkholderia aenigmatica]